MIPSPHEIREFRMLVQIIHHETAAGDHLQSVGADQVQRALYQRRGDAAATLVPRRLGVGDDDGRWRQAVIRERQPALGVELEAGEDLVVADAACRHDSISAK